MYDDQDTPTEYTLPDFFNRVPQTDQEVMAGSILTNSQIACIKNLIADLATTLVSKELSVTNQDVFIELANIRGRIEALNYLVVRSEHYSQGN